MAERKEPETDHRSGKKTALSEAIIVAVLPIMAYLVIFVYRAGYFRPFGLPMQLISFDIVEIFIVMGGMLSLVWILFSVVNLGFTLFPDAHPAIAWRVRVVLPAYVILVAVFFLFDHWLIILGVFAYAVGYTLIMFWPPRATDETGKSYQARLQAEDMRRRSEDLWRGSLIVKFMGYVDRRAFYALVYLVILLVVSHFKGYSDASHKKDFYVVNTSPASVVLYMTRDRAICSPFDRNTKQVGPGFTILDITSNPTVTYRLEQVGPLQLSQPTPLPSPIPTVVSPTALPSPSVVPSPTPP